MIPASADPDPDDARLDAMRDRLARSPVASLEASPRMDDLLAEVRPFVEAARRAEATSGDSAAWGEARSLAWLFAYRMGDQGTAPLAVSAAVSAWRDVVGTDWARDAADEATALLLDGYARGREDRARTDAQRALAEALPATAVAPGAVLVVAAGPLDPDGARALADRASAVMLRADARAALLDVGGLTAPTPAVLSELWAVVSAARMLGVRMVVSGESEALSTAMEGAPLPEAATLRAPGLAAGVELLLREASAASRGSRGFTAWLRGLLPGGRSR